YEEVLKKDPTYTKAAFNLGNLYFQLGDNKRALTLFERVLELEPNSAEAWNNLGSINETVGNLDKATIAYQQSLKLNQFQEEAHVNLACILYSQYQSQRSELIKDEIVERLKFVLTINSHNTKAQKLLQELMDQC
ncbi:MAG: tetratricopeptide repeat protein, partial [Deltaproteobacteria bacterium]|nr:tetratricopeptide repeat protein [Deltaproteobacteria bacterium]